jgi:hypothetical protein
LHCAALQKCRAAAGHLGRGSSSPAPNVVEAGRYPLEADRRFTGSWWLTPPCTVSRASTLHPPCMVPLVVILTAGADSDAGGADSDACSMEHNVQSIVLLRPKCDPHAVMKYCHNVPSGARVGVTFPRVWPYFGLGKNTAGRASLAEAVCLPYTGRAQPNQHRLHWFGLCCDRRLTPRAPLFLSCANVIA